MKSLNLRENEIALILEALAQSIGNQSKAADLLGITRHALRRRMVKLRISPNGPDASSMAFRLRWLLRDRQPRSSADIIAALTTRRATLAIDEKGIRRRAEELGRLTVHWAPAAFQAAKDRADLLALIDHEREADADFREEVVRYQSLQDLEAAKREAVAVKMLCDALGDGLPGCHYTLHDESGNICGSGHSKGWDGRGAGSALSAMKNGKAAARRTLRRWSRQS